MLRFHAHGFECVPSVPDAAHELHRQFEEQHRVDLPGLIPPRMLESMREMLANIKFERLEVSGIATEDATFSEGLVDRLRFLANEPALFRFMEQITAGRRILSFNGRIAHRLPGPESKVNWHSDLHDGHHLMGLSINLSAAPFEGGEFQLRDADSHEILWTHSPAEPGDAFVFPVSPRFQHRVLPVSGSVPRIVFVGWFLSKTVHPSYGGGRFFAHVQRLDAFEECPPVDIAAANMGARTPFRLGDETQFHRDGDDLVVHDWRNESFYRLDPIATRILDLLLTTGTLSGTVEGLMVDYDVDSAEAELATLELVAALDHHGLLDSTHGCPPN